MVTDQKIKQEGHSDASQEIFKDVTYFIVGDVSADVSGFQLRFVPTQVYGFHNVFVFVEDFSFCIIRFDM